MLNPHRLNLGQFSLRVQAGGGKPTTALTLASLTEASQQLHLWEGMLESNFTVSSASGAACAYVPDNFVATFSCGGSENGTITGFSFASYGQPTGSCSTGFEPSPTCASNTTLSVLTKLCAGLTTCSLMVNYEAGFGDPCSGQAKGLAAVTTCGPPAAPAVGNASVRVATVVHPDVDAVAFSLACDLAGSPCPIALRLAFPYGSPYGVTGADWAGPDSKHTTLVEMRADGDGVTFSRTLDGDAYRVDCTWTGAQLSLTRVTPHVFDIAPPQDAPWPANTPVGVTCLLSPVAPDGAGLRYPVGRDEPWMVAKAAATESLLSTGPPSFDTVRALAAASWADYWTHGAFIAFEGRDSDADAMELERRIVLSLYLTRVHSTGAEPPAETGLLCNSWCVSGNVAQLMK